VRLSYVQAAEIPPCRRSPVPRWYLRQFAVAALVPAAVCGEPVASCATAPDGRRPERIQALPDTLSAEISRGAVKTHTVCAMTALRSILRQRHSRADPWMLGGQPVSAVRSAGGIPGRQRLSWPRRRGGLCRRCGRGTARRSRRWGRCGARGPAGPTATSSRRRDSSTA
jgi:hypothetical protein